MKISNRPQIPLEIARGWLGVEAVGFDLFELAERIDQGDAEILFEDWRPPQRINGIGPGRGNPLGTLLVAIADDRSPRIELLGDAMMHSGAGMNGTHRGR